MFALFAFGTLGFWLVSAVAFVALVLAVEFRRSFFSGIFLILTLTFLDVVAHISVVSYSLHHPLSALYMALGYIVVGTVWATVKWYLYLRKSYHQTLASREKWATSGTGCRDYATFSAKANAIQKADLEKYLQGLDSYNPKVSKHKSSIIFWMTYWPFSVAGSVLTDFFRGIFNRVYMEIAAFLQRMSDRTFAGFRQEIAVAPEDVAAERKKIQDEKDEEKKRKEAQEDEFYGRHRGIRTSI
jgi:hypothetical protein